MIHDIFLKRQKEWDELDLTGIGTLMSKGDEFDHKVVPHELKKLNSFSTETLIQVLEAYRDRLEEQKTFPARMFQLNNGKMPFVVMNGKAEEGEKYQIFSMAFKDAINQEIAYLDTEIKKLK